MTSEIRANTIKNRVGLGTVSYTNTGIVVSGIVTANSFSGTGDLDVDGHTNLDNVSIAGVVTTTGSVNVGDDLDVTDDLTIGGELKMMGSSDSAKYFDARVGTSNNLNFRSTSGGDSNHVTMMSLNTSGASIIGDLSLGDGTADSAAGPEFKLNRNSASPANADYLGQIKFAGRSSTGVERNYAKITGKILDVTNGSEDGILEFAHIKNGSQTITGRWRSDSLQLLNGTSLTVAGTADVTGNMTVGGNLDVSGVLTYEDVTNVDSVGIVTARSGVYVQGNPAEVRIQHTGNSSYSRLISDSSNNLKIYTGGGPHLAVTIDASKRLLLGGQSARVFGGGTSPHFQMEGLTEQAAHMTITRVTNDGYGSVLSLAKSRGTSLGSNTIVQDNDTLGVIQFRGTDGSDIYSVAASIHAEVDGSPSNGTDMPGALVLGTSADGASSPTQRLRIASNGKTHLNYDASSSPGADRLNIMGGGDGISIARSTANASDNNILGNISFHSYMSGSYHANAEAKIEAVAEAGQSGSNAPARLIFYTKDGGTGPGSSPTTKMTILSGGSVNIGGDYAQTTHKLKVTGSFAATTKSFVIDHPTKENHKLQYACLEGPENSVYVRGRSSDPVIELPDYWIGLVHEDSITVNVTPIGNKNVWVESINNNSVTIGTDGSTEYFYTVFAERKDVEKLEVEVQK